MNDRMKTSWQDLHSLFSIVMCIDQSMTICYASDTLGESIPETMTSPAFADVFTAVRPGRLETFQHGLDVLGSLCLLTANNGKFAIRGQLILFNYDGENALCFCGAPWLHWINTNSPETRLKLSDFSAQDVQLDQLFFMSTERKIIEDLEKVNRELQVAKQQLEESQQAQGEFFAQMSHEIRTPLNGVVSALALLEHCSPGSEQSKFLHLAQSSSHNLMQVINYVMNVSKIELAVSGEETVFSWPELITSTVNIVSAKAEQKSLAIEIDLAPDLSPVCIGSPDRLRQTLLNLLINAIKFTDHGTVRIRAFPTDKADGQQIVRFEVIDSGLGISAENLENIFEPFWSSHAEDSKHQEEGSGLGLDIVRRNVNSMGGQIEVISQPGLGTKFWFELPVSCATDDQVEEAEKQQEQEIGELQGNVLLVDDNETNLLLGSLILESLGLNVVSVDGGAAAVAAVRHDNFDLVLMDISMPDINGLEATRQIRSFISSEELTIIALTAYVDNAEKQACFEVGMQDYLTKPIIKDDLHRVLADWLVVANAQETSEDRPTHEASAEMVLEILVEHTTLAEMREQIGTDNLKLVVNKVQSESAERWKELEKADAHCDSNAIRLHVHSLASIFGSIGLAAIATAMGAIEADLREGIKPSPGWLEALVQLRIDSLSALDSEIAKL